MIILTLRTDNPQAQLALLDNEVLLASRGWLADRQLAETLHTEINRLLVTQKYELADVGGIVIYSGPGSFTGLRISVATANALAYAQGLRIVGTTGDEWQQLGIQRLLVGHNETQVVPFYGAEPNITVQKK